MPEGTPDDEADEIVARQMGVSVGRVRGAREASAKLDAELEAWLADQIMRGPGRSRSGGSTERLGKPCPTALSEYFFAQRMGFQVMPGDLAVGHIDDQPADTYLMYSNLLSREAEIRERLEYLQQRKASKPSKRR